MVIISRLICNNLNLQTLSHSLKNLDIKVEINAQSGKSWRTAISIDNLYLCLVWFGFESKEHVKNMAHNKQVKQQPQQIKRWGGKISRKYVKDIFARDYLKNRLIIKRMPFYCTYPQLFSQLKQTIFFRTDKKQVGYRSIMIISKLM